MESSNRDRDDEPPSYTAESQAPPRLNGTPKERNYEDAPSQSPLDTYLQGQAFGGYSASANSGHIIFITTEAFLKIAKVVPEERDSIPEERESIPPPPSYRGLSIFACLCCCWTFGCCAINQSLKVNSAIDRGDLDSAYKASRLAKRLAIWSIVLGLALIIFVITMSIVKTPPK